MGYILCSVEVATLARDDKVVHLRTYVAHDVAICGVVDMIDTIDIKPVAV
jgi:hypothetical protein